jgi:tRNA-specific 2-thiouridylase
LRKDWGSVTSSLALRCCGMVTYMNTSDTNKTSSKPSVVVAMSGGVDSSVAAHLLQQQGYPLVGVSMQVWDYKRNSAENSRASCCSPADFCDARMVAAKLEIPYYVVDFEKTFEREVISKFVSSYQQGLTPNPCIDCNNKVKFRELRDRAASFGCSHVATGHYAQIRSSSQGYHLLRGADRSKDQSYFLYTCKQEELRSTLFPVGEYTKPEIREIAREAGLATADKPESQDICFVSGSVQDFVTRIGGGKERGNFVTTNGAVIGQHEGVHRYTVGQRRGLHLGGSSEPLYVIGLSAATNEVVVGAREELKREGFSVGEMHWVSPLLIERVAEGVFPYSLDIMVQVRSRHEGVRARMTVLDRDNASIAWIADWAPVSPGQAAVIYDLQNEEVLAGGRIAIDHHGEHQQFKR